MHLVLKKEPADVQQGTHRSSPLTCSRAHSLGHTCALLRCHIFCGQMGETAAFPPSL